MIIPLDERPCNYNFTSMMLKETPYQAVLPPKSILGNKKEPADLKQLDSWILDNLLEVDAVILSIDMYLYGGIVPSRLHFYSVEQLTKKLDQIKSWKQLKPGLKIYAYNLIMRCPSYSSDDEEPDYYEDYGKKIFTYGICKDINGDLTSEEAAKYDELKAEIPPQYLNDYQERRFINKQVNKHFLKLVSDKILDFGLIPIDDSAPRGFTAMDKTEVLNHLEKLNLLDEVGVYPGADEVSNVLTVKYILEDLNVIPSLYLKYLFPETKLLYPVYEDRPMADTVNSHLKTLGLNVVSSVEKADLYFLVSNPRLVMEEAFYQKFDELTYNKIIDEINIIKKIQKPIGIADVTFGNGGNLMLLKGLHQENFLYSIDAYAGWNTNSNTLGTILPQLVLSYLFPNRKSNLEFLSLRYIEDFFYDADVRQIVNDSLKEPYNYFLIDGIRGSIVQTIKKQLEKHIKNYLKPYYNVKIIDIYSPWNRMFEIGLEVEIL